MSLPQVLVILGAQWGDEGKGKLVDLLSAQFDICGRFNGGANAGHTIVVNSKKYAFHLVPCGVLHQNTTNVIGNGCVVHIPTLLHELELLDAEGLNYHGRLFLSDRAHLVFDYHLDIDGKREEGRGTEKIGTTRKGIGPTYSDKMNRIGIRAGIFKNFDPIRLEQELEKALSTHKKTWDLTFDVAAEVQKYAEYAKKIQPFIRDTIVYVNKSLNEGKKILIEGANAVMLDIDFGTYPYVTSSSTTIGGCSTGLGIPPSKINCTVGIVKAYTTRVGAGPFPTELLDDVGNQLRKIGHEYGTTTGRPRRCGWLDLVVVKYGHMLNNYQYLNLTKLDVLSGLNELKVGVSYKLNGETLDSIPSDLEDLAKVEVEYVTFPGWSEDLSACRTFESLPPAAQRYVSFIEEFVAVKCRWVGVGAGREDMIDRGV